MSLTLLFLDEFNTIMEIKLFLKLGKPSNVIIQVAKLENLFNSATKLQQRCLSLESIFQRI